MSLFTEQQLKSIAVQKAGVRSASRVLKEELAASNVLTKFDSFLSHSIKDADIILGVKAILEGQGLSVYVDWIDDPELDRENVSSATAERLKVRMRQSKTLIYAHSINSPQSKWMPWEIGYFDGYRGAVLIFPISKSNEEEFKGQEFLGMYPYIDNIRMTSLFVNQGGALLKSLGTVELGRTFKDLKKWVGERPA